MIQLYTGSSILSFGILVALAGIIFSREPKERLNQSFAIMCSFMAVTALTEAMLRGASGMAEAEIWMRIGTMSWHWAVTLMLFFCLFYTKKDAILKNRIVFVSLLLLPLALSVLDLATPLLGAEPVLLLYGYERRISAGSALLPAAAGWELGASLASFLLLVVFHRSAKERTARRQAAWITIGFLLPLLAGVLTQAVLPQWGIRLPSVMSLSGVWLAGFVGFAMQRYDLFVLDPAQAADRMLSVMREAVLLLDTEGTVVYANRSARSFWERSHQLILGRSVTEVCGPGFAEAGGLERLLGSEREAVMEISWTGAEGSVVSMTVSGAFLRDSLGDVKGAVLVGTDISGQKRLEATLQSSRRMLRDLVDNGEANILLVDTQGVIQAANEPFARNFGFSPSNIVGENLFTFFPDAVAQERNRRLAQVVATGVPMHYQDMRADRHWEHRLTPVTDDEGRITGVTIFTIDVTERVEAERTKERLIAELSDALAKVKTLTGLIPICAHCKRIRNDGGYWQQVEQYVAEHTDADFSHGLCNDCIRKLYPELADEVLGDKSDPTNTPR